MNKISLKSSREFVPSGTEVTMNVVSFNVSTNSSLVITGVLQKVFPSIVKPSNGVDQKVFLSDDKSIPPNHFNEAFSSVQKISRFIVKSPPQEPHIYRSKKTTGGVPRTLLPDL